MLIKRSQSGHSQKFKIRNAFSLIEIMVVIIIIGLVAGLVGVTVFGQLDQARVDTTITNIRGLQTALDLYRLSNQSYPQTEQGLDALITKPEVGKIPNSWSGPYINGQLPKDGWDNDFIYRSGGKQYEIISYGSDGEEGGAETATDINSKDL